MIPITAFVAGFGLGYYKAAKAKRLLPDRMLQGAIFAIIGFLAAMAFGLLLEAMLRT